MIIRLFDRRATSRLFVDKILIMLNKITICVETCADTLISVLRDLSVEGIDKRTTVKEANTVLMPFAQ